MAKSPTHDITISTLAGTPLGFMLQRDRQGRRGFSIVDADQLVPAFRTGEMTEAEAPSELRLYFSQDDWRAGAGGVTDREHPKKYASAVLIDATARSAIRPAHLSKAVTFDNNPTTFLSSGFAVVGTEVWGFSGRDVFIWDYTNKEFDKKTAPVAAAVLYRNGVTLGANTFAASWRTSADEPGDYIFKADSDANWTLSTVGDRFKYFARGKNGDNDDVIWGGYIAEDTTETINEGGQFSNSDVTLTVTTDITATPHAVVVGDVIIIDDEYMLVTAAAATELTVTRGYLGSTAATHEDLAKIWLYRPHHINQETNPTNGGGGWATASIAVGTIDAPITALISDGDTLLVCKTDGVYAAYADGTVANLTPEFQANAHPDNFRNAFNWNGHILLPLGAGGMLELLNGRLYDVSMELYAPKQTEWHGRVAALHGDPTRLYMLIQESANTRYHLFIGEWLAADDNLDWRWHHAALESYTTGTTVNYASLFAEGVPEGTKIHHRCWIGIQSTGSSRFPAFLAQEDDDEDAFTINSSARIVLTDYDANLPRIFKNALTADFDSTNLGAAGRKWTVEFNLNEGAGWQSTLKDSAGNTDGVIDSTTGKETLTFPDGSVYKVLSLRAQAAADAQTTTPSEINKLRVTSQLRPDRLRLLPLKLRLAYDMRLLNGTTAGSVTGDLAQLRIWDGQAAAVTVVDPEGTSRNYVFLGGTLKIRELRKEVGRRPEYLIEVLLAES